MSKKILIDSSHSDEIRVAVTLNGKLDDYEIETGKKQTVKGDVYLAKITRVEPSLQAAFIDFGSNRNGFLPLTEIHPDYFKIPIADQEKLSTLLQQMQSNNTEENLDKPSKNEESVEENQDALDASSSDEETPEINQEEISESKNQHKIKNPKKEYANFFRKYKIQDVIKPRQVILVQISKEERGFKGAALTTFLSFAGRYCVLMPNSLNNDGISRKIGDVEERKKLKAILSSVNVPENMSVIIRTAGIGKTKKEISKDLSYLTAQWNKIRELTLKSEAPNLIYEEGNIIKRTIRDMLTDDVDEVIIDGKNGYDTAKQLTKNIVPTQLKNIKLFKEKNKSLFSENKIESQVNELFSLTVKLESGGSIVINTTEALVAIDVNSGKNTSERNIENTALKTNLEAAVEVARQLRLRDLGGLVVIDFIDMDDYRNNYKVEKTIKTALYKDRARVQVGRISMFGLLELSRQRLRSSLVERAFEKCPYCNGSGLILNTNSMGDQIINIIKEKVTNSKGLKINVKCNSALAETLINGKREEITNLEKQFESKITFAFDSYYLLHEPNVEVEDNKLDNDKLKKIKETKEIKSKNVIKKISKNKEIKISKNKEIKIKPRKKKAVEKKDPDLEPDEKDLEENNKKIVAVKKKEIKIKPRKKKVVEKKEPDLEPDEDNLEENKKKITTVKKKKIKIKPRKKKAVEKKDPDLEPDEKDLEKNKKLSTKKKEGLEKVIKDEKSGWWSE